MHQHRGVKVLPGKGMIQITEKYDRKFQALGLVNTHQLHAACAAGDLHLRRFSGLHQPPQLGNEGKQSPVAAAFKALSMAGQGNQIFLPGGTLVHRAENAQQIQRIVKMPQQAAHAHVPRRFPQGGQGGQKGLHILPTVCQQGVIKITVPVMAADLRQPVRHKAEHRRPQHGNQRHILPGIVDDLQQ